MSGTCHLQARCLARPPVSATLLGIGLLIYRRRIQTPVWLATTRNDKLMYLVLVCAIVAGLACTLMGATHEGDMRGNWRSVPVWISARSEMLAPRGDPDGPGDAVLPDCMC